MHAGSVADIDRLLQRTPGEHRGVDVGRALHLFRSRGPVAEANAALAAAKRVNRHVVPYLSASAPPRRAARVHRLW